jgi:hypothetical protein
MIPLTTELFSLLDEISLNGGAGGSGKGPGARGSTDYTDASPPKHKGNGSKHESNPGHRQGRSPSKESLAA